ncbi:Mov34/MPN/PAD-1 family protein [Nocardiopsis flavescens]|uniref:Mov34/MPN/PAD-1 family protein n=1 Tax=Nocardiopsis flavescens TaxID=758803 RepID=UPI003657A195
MLTMSTQVKERLIAHARRVYPLEACGIVAGPAGSGRAVRVVEMANALGHPRRFQFDPHEQLRVWRRMDELGEQPVVIYHSHPTTAPVPSRTDIAGATEPGAVYVIVSLRDPARPKVKAWKMPAAGPVEEPINLIEGDAS